MPSQPGPSAGGVEGFAEGKHSGESIDQQPLAITVLSDLNHALAFLKPDLKRMKLIESKTLSATNMIFGKNSLEENKEETIKLACVTDNTELIWTLQVKRKVRIKEIPVHWCYKSHTF